MIFILGQEFQCFGGSEHAVDPVIGNLAGIKFAQNCGFIDRRVSSGLRVKIKALCVMHPDSAMPAMLTASSASCPDSSGAIFRKNGFFPIFIPL